MRRYLIAVLAVLGLAQAQQDYTTSVKVLYEDTSINFFFSGTSKRTIGPSCDLVLNPLKALKKYSYGAMDHAGSCYTVTIRNAADRKQEIENFANYLDARYTKRSSRTAIINKQTYEVQEWTKYREDGGLILAFETTDNQMLRIVAIPVTKY